MGIRDWYTGVGRRLAALVVVLALVFAACGGGDDGDSGDDGGGGGSDDTGQAAFNALFFRAEGDGTSSGGASPVQVRVQPFGGDEFRVGLTEDEVAGTGDQWRAAAWQAAITATLLTGETLVGREILYDVKGYIDGPSAGGAMTVATLAAMRGDEMNPDVVMTGTINPDGTIGPVGGIPQKVQGAIEVADGEVEAIGASSSGDVPIVLAQDSEEDPGSDEDAEDSDSDDSDSDSDSDSDDSDDSDADDSDGDTDMVMLIPAGQATAYDMDTGENVDVVDLGRREGVEVREVGDVYEAYRAFTGQDLPRLDDDGDTNLDADANDRIEASVDRWLARYREAANQLGTLGIDGQGFVIETGLDVSAAEAAENAQRLSDQGLQAGAWGSAREAAALAQSALAAGRGWELGFDAWEADLASRAAVCDEVVAVVDQFATFTPESVTDASGLIAGYTTLVDSVSLCNQAAYLLERPVETQEDVILDLLIAGLYFEFADVLILSSEDQLEFARDLGGRDLDDDVNLTATADFFRRAAEANLAAFDALIVAEEANAAGVSTDIAKDWFLENFIEYSLAVGGLNVLRSLDEYFGDEDVSAYARLGGSLEVYSLTSSLLAQFYSMGAQIDDSFSIVGVQHERALMNALDLGEDQLAGAIVSLRSEDVNPTSVVGSFEAARVDREGDVADKFGALTGLWAGYTAGRMLAYLGGFQTSGLDG